MTQTSKTRIMTECAIMVALSAVLQLIPFVKLANGGSITLASMAPIVFIALRHGVKWGLLTAFVGSLVQMLLGGISAPPTETFFWFLLVILLDYVIAYTVLGLAPVFAKPFQNQLVGAGVGTFAVTLLRYICHIVSGILIWGVYAPEDQPVWLYSIGYNGSYMVPEIIITVVIVVLLWKFVAMRALKNRHA
ncbi:energy-coupled thiamine transporter ThiT [Hydrogenoanaerobacterium sp.]|uniref:energy-coupled thiamine transporter ThiT n=1 Tax=Hydrogenoanaerobacterium sp. TaxID=2953763 RepID=UPI00289F2C9E|nr:energy-coupled thiamine transporter ThiT [Hydrogenoanaerobacterium sp.]